MKRLCLFLFLFSSTTTFGLSFYDFKEKSVDGKELKFSEFRGKTVLVVNVATRCGYTGQLDDLEVLYKKYKPKGLVVVGVPSNDFGGQTPEGNKEVGKFCRLKYGVTFPLLEKRPVKGSAKDDLMKFLVNGGEEISWNFEKFLVSPKGKVVGRFKSGVEPGSEELQNSIKKTF